MWKIWPFLWLLGESRALKFKKDFYFILGSVAEIKIFLSFQARSYLHGSSFWTQRVFSTQTSPPRLNSPSTPNSFSSRGTSSHSYMSWLKIAPGPWAQVPVITVGRVCSERPSETGWRPGASHFPLTTQRGPPTRWGPWTIFISGPPAMRPGSFPAPRGLPGWLLRHQHSPAPFVVQFSSPS